MIVATGLTKRYGRTLALNDFTLTVPDGAVFGLLGPNGSGKSTFLKLLMGFIFPDAGRIEPGGLSTTRMGYLPERPFFPAQCGIEEYLLAVGRLGGLEGKALQDSVRDRLAQVGLSDVARRRISTCSRGMLQRLALATSLLDSPKLLIWDEPMGGLDPAWQKSVRDLIKDLAQAGVTMLISTHDLSEVEQVCTHVAILYRGRLMRAGNLEAVLTVRRQTRITVDHMPAEVQASLLALGAGVSVVENLITLCDDAVERKREALGVLLQAGLDIQRLEQARSTLEEIYLEAIRT